MDIDRASMVVAKRCVRWLAVDPACLRALKVWNAMAGRHFAVSISTARLPAVLAVLVGILATALCAKAVQDRLTGSPSHIHDEKLAGTTHSRELSPGAGQNLRASFLSFAGGWSFDDGHGLSPLLLHTSNPIPQNVQAVVLIAHGEQTRTRGFRSYLNRRIGVLEPKESVWTPYPTPTAGSAAGSFPPQGCAGRCLNPHPGPFRSWNGQVNGCWVQVWRQWPEGCTHYQWFNSCANYWDPQIWWTCCVH
jgi:hypothetical protein